LKIKLIIQTESVKFDFDLNLTPLTTCCVCITRPNLTLKLVVQTAAYLVIFSLCHITLPFTKIHFIQTFTNNFFRYSWNISNALEFTVCHGSLQTSSIPEQTKNKSAMNKKTHTNNKWSKKRQLTPKTNSHCFKILQIHVYHIPFSKNGPPPTRRRFETLTQLKRSNSRQVPGKYNITKPLQFRLEQTLADWEKKMQSMSSSINRLKLFQRWRWRQKTPLINK